MMGRIERTKEVTLRTGTLEDGSTLDTKNISNRVVTYRTDSFGNVAGEYNVDEDVTLGVIVTASRTNADPNRLG